MFIWKYSFRTRYLHSVEKVEISHLQPVAEYDYECIGTSESSSQGVPVLLKRSMMFPQLTHSNFWSLYAIRTVYPRCTRRFQNCVYEF